MANGIYATLRPWALHAHSSHLLSHVSAWSLTSRTALRRIFQKCSYLHLRTFKNLLPTLISPPLCPTALLVPDSRLALLGASIILDPWSPLLICLPRQVEVSRSPSSNPPSPRPERICSFSEARKHMSLPELSSLHT